MKKKLLFIIPILLVLIISSIIAIAIFNNKINVFSLENKYYGNNDITEIDLNQLNELIDKKESFGIFVYQPMCITSADFEKVLYDFQAQNSISFYKIAFSKVKNELKDLNYYPSFIIYNNGKMVDFLESDKDEDIKYYQSADGFEEWLTKYVKLDNNSNVYKNNSNENSSSHPSFPYCKVILTILLCNN